LQGQQCEWVRTLDYQPPTGRPDRATVRIERGTLYETGDPSSTLGTSYQEIFHRISSGHSTCVATQLADPDTSAIGSLSRPGSRLVLFVDWFLFPEPRSQPLPSPPNLSSLVSTSAPPLALS